MLEESNRLRAAAGKRAHAMSPDLCKAAQNHARYMANTGDFSHDGNGGLAGRKKKFSLTGTLRENIGKGQVNVAEVFSSWKDSNGHYANITSDTTQAGFGYARDSRGVGYWVAIYSE